MQHLEEGTIHAWLDGELPAAEQAQAERHVAECADCAAAVAEARGMIAGASRIVSALDVVRGAGGGGVVPRQSATPAAPRSVWHSLRLTPTRAALAASLLVAAGALLTAKHDTADKSLLTPFAESATAPQMVAPSSAGPVPAASALASPKPSIPVAADSIAVRSAVTAAARKSNTQQQVQAASKSVLTEGRRADSPRFAPVPAANAIAAGPVSTDVARERVAAPPPSAPASNVRTPISAAASATGATGAAGAAGAVVVADRGRDQARAALDSLDAKARPDTVRAAPESRRALRSEPLRLESVMTTGAVASVRLDLAGCYQIKSDTNASSRLLPDRFALLRTTSGAAPNIVRAVTPDGKVDSIVTGSNWVQISNDMAQIQSTVGTKHQVVSLQLTNLGGVSGQAFTPEGKRPIDVARAACRP